MSNFFLFATSERNDPIPSAIMIRMFPLSPWYKLQQLSNNIVKFTKDKYRWEAMHHPQKQRYFEHFDDDDADAFLPKVPDFMKKIWDKKLKENYF